MRRGRSRIGCGGDAARITSVTQSCWWCLPGRRVTVRAMKIFLLTALTMTAFAANSILNRAALTDGAIGPGSFAALRLAAGVIMLMILLGLRDRKRPRLQAPQWIAVAGLVAYMLGFSFAYISLEAGLGALILFGGVQITMFAGTVLQGEHPPAQRWLGAAVAFGGLCVLFWPSGANAPPLLGAGLMALAALGWGIYSLQGRGVTDPLAATAGNFLYALPFALVALVLVSRGEGATPAGIGLAILSGAVTSGMGYALWYAILPRLGATVGALAQLSVPVIALVAGAVLLGEGITARAVLAAALVLGGIAVGVRAPQRRIGSSGS